jgi:uncharacterized membrane protein
MRISTRMFLVALILIGTGVGLFVWGATADLQPAQGVAPGEPMRVIGQIAGAMIGVGAVPLVAGLVMRLRGR